MRGSSGDWGGHCLSGCRGGHWNSQAPGGTLRPRDKALGRWQRSEGHTPSGWGLVPEEEDKEEGEERGAPFMAFLFMAEK